MVVSSTSSWSNTVSNYDLLERISDLLVNNYDSSASDDHTSVLSSSLEFLACLP